MTTNSKISLCLESGQLQYDLHTFGVGKIDRLFGFAETIQQ